MRTDLFYIFFFKLQKNSQTQVIKHSVTLPIRASSCLTHSQLISQSYACCEIQYVSECLHTPLFYTLMTLQICREVLSTDSDTEREAKREPQKKQADRIKLKAAGRDRDRDVQYEKVEL